MARHLTVYQDSLTVSYRFPDSSSIPGGSIEKALPPQQFLDTWGIDRDFVLGSDELFLDTCSIPQLSMTISSTPTSIASLTPLDTYIYRALLRVYIYCFRDLILISSISLNLSTPVHLPNTLSVTPNLFLCDFSSFFKFFYTQ